MKLQPIFNNLVIKGTAKEPQGFIIPETANKERPATGTVVAIGEGVKKVKVEDMVLVKAYMTDEIEIDEEKYLMCQEEAIIGIIND